MDAKGVVRQNQSKNVLHLTGHMPKHVIRMDLPGVLSYSVDEVPTRSFTVLFYCFTVNITGEPATKTLRVVAKCKPLADRFVDIFGDWIKQQTGDVRQYAEMFRHVSYFRLVVLAFL